MCLCVCDVVRPGIRIRIRCAVCAPSSTHNACGTHTPVRVQPQSHAHTPYRNRIRGTAKGCPKGALPLAQRRPKDSISLVEHFSLHVCTIATHASRPHLPFSSRDGACQDVLGLLIFDLVPVLCHRTSPIWHDHAAVRRTAGLRRSSMNHDDGRWLRAMAAG